MRSLRSSMGLRGMALIEGTPWSSVGRMSRARCRAIFANSRVVRQDNYGFARFQQQPVSSANFSNRFRDGHGMPDEPGSHTGAIWLLSFGLPPNMIANRRKTVNRAAVEMERADHGRTQGAY